MWEIPEDSEAWQHFKPGHVTHTVGWPLSHFTYGGSFIYMMKPNLIHIGYVIALNY